MSPRIFNPELICECASPEGLAGLVLIVDAAGGSAACAATSLGPAGSVAAGTVEAVAGVAVSAFGGSFEEGFASSGLRHI